MTSTFFFSERWTLFLWVERDIAYQEKWRPLQGDILLLAREPNNRQASGCGLKKTATLWDMFLTTCHLLSQFLKRDFNKAVVEVTGDRVNRGAGYGLEVPCIYRLYWPEAYLHKRSSAVTRCKNRLETPR